MQVHVLLGWISFHNLSPSGVEQAIARTCSFSNMVQRLIWHCTVYLFPTIVTESSADCTKCVVMVALQGVMDGTSKFSQLNHKFFGDSTTIPSSTYIIQYTPSIKSTVLVHADQVNTHYMTNWWVIFEGPNIWEADMLWWIWMWGGWGREAAPAPPEEGEILKHIFPLCIFLYCTCMLNVM